MFLITLWGRNDKTILIDLHRKPALPARSALARNIVGLVGEKLKTFLLGREFFRKERK
jgi:hypothetical protein